MRRSLDGVAALIALGAACAGCGRVQFDERLEDAGAAAVDDPRQACAQSRGLVGYWPFDDAIGTTAADYSGHAQHGELVAEATWSEGRVGGALTFDDVDDTVRLPGTPAADFGDGTGSFSVSYWIRPTVLVARELGIRPFEIAYCTGSAYILTFVDPDGAVGFSGYDAVGGAAHYASTAAGAGTLSAGTWTHVTHVLDRAAGMGHTYVDGAEVDTSSLARWTDVIDCSGAQSILYIGGWGPYQYAGALDDVRIYEWALASTEVAELAQLTATGCPW